MRSSLILIFATTLLLACGGDDDDNGQGTPDAAGNVDAAGNPDAPMIDAAPLGACPDDLLTQADGSDANETNSNVVISEVDPGESIELYNAGNETVMLSATGYFWCNNRSYPSFASLNVEITAGGKRTIPWPGGGGGEAGGDVSIYSQAGFNGGQANILDYVCWGDAAAGGATRLVDATNVGKWNNACAPAIPAGGSLARLGNQDGTEAEDYEILATPTPENCE